MNVMHLDMKRVMSFAKTDKIIIEIHSVVERLSMRKYSLKTVLPTCRQDLGD